MCTFSSLQEGARNLGDDSSHKEFVVVCYVDILLDLDVDLSHGSREGQGKDAVGCVGRNVAPCT